MLESAIAAGATHLRGRAFAEQGFRRCGRLWPQAGAEVPLEELTIEEINRLRAEPSISVEIVRLTGDE